MNPAERRIVLCIWNAIIVFGSLYYLTGQFWKATVIGGFVLISGVLNFGARWLFPLGFAVTMFTILIAVGIVPRPAVWPELIEKFQAFVAAANRS